MPYRGGITEPSEALVDDWIVCEELAPCLVVVVSAKPGIVTGAEGEVGPVVDAFWSNFHLLVRTL